MDEQDLHDAIIAGNYKLAEEIGHILDGQNQRPTLLQSALWYAAQGLPIFPCRPREKRPMTRNGLKDASTDPGQIKAWWQATPGANIAAPTGIMFDVVDIDGPVGIASIAKHIDRLRPCTIGTVSTPRRGGLHYYLPPTRGTGGYVLLPPSITDEHGEGLSYRWLRPPSFNAAEGAS